MYGKYSILFFRFAIKFLILFRVSNDSSSIYLNGTPLSMQNSLVTKNCFFANEIPLLMILQ